tara:strand:- start:229 stop:378 length:150 start_codon:yes stop_codon:yes gene_type:complete
MSNEKKQQISKVLVSLISSGLTAQEAVDKLFGNGTYEKLAGDLYDSLSV